MAEVDTSSYPKAALPVSPLDLAGKLGGLQQQQQQIQSGALGIDKQKLDLVNQRYGTLAKQLTALANKPDLSEKDLTGFIDNDVKLGILPQDMAGTIKSQIPAKATPAQLKNHIEGILTNAQSTVEAINFHYGTPGTLDNGQAITPVIQSPKIGLQTTGAPIQKQLPPTTPVVNAAGQNQMLGVQPPMLAPGTTAVPGGPVANRFPLPATPPGANPILGQSSNFGGNVTGVQVGPNTAAPQQPTGPVTANPPMFEQGTKDLANDQQVAYDTLNRIKPAMQALPLLKGLTTGAGTPKFNDAVALLSNLGFVPQGLTDKTAIYQEVSKKLAQYVQGSPAGQRSDAAQTLAEASSPSPKTQINPALIKLTKDAIILDRVRAATPNVFEGNDYSKYGKHRSTFPATIDERAFGLDLLEPEERKKLLDRMSKNRDTYEGKKFWKSLAIVDKQGLINTGVE